MSYAKRSNERAALPRVLCGKASQRAGSQTEIVAFLERLGQCWGLSFLAMRRSSPGKEAPSQQKLCGESSADKLCQQGSAERHQPLPARDVPPGSAAGAFGSFGSGKMPSSLGGSTLRATRCATFPAQGSGHCKRPAVPQGPMNRLAGSALPVKQHRSRLCLTCNSHSPDQVQGRHST